MRAKIDKLIVKSSKLATTSVSKKFRYMKVPREQVVHRASEILPTMYCLAMRDAKQHLNSLGHSHSAQFSSSKVATPKVKFNFAMMVSSSSLLSLLSNFLQRNSFASRLQDRSSSRLSPSSYKTQKKDRTPLTALLPSSLAVPQGFSRRTAICGLRLPIQGTADSTTEMLRNQLSLTQSGRMITDCQKTRALP